SRCPDVTTPQRPAGRERTNSGAPGIGTRPSVPNSSIRSKRFVSAAMSRRGATVRRISEVRRPWAMARKGAGSSPFSAAQTLQTPSTTRRESASTPSRSKRTARQLSSTTPQGSVSVSDAHSAQWPYIQPQYEPSRAPPPRDASRGLSRPCGRAGGSSSASPDGPRTRDRKLDRQRSQFHPIHEFGRHGDRRHGCRYDRRDRHPAGPWNNG